MPTRYTVRQGDSFDQFVVPTGRTRNYGLDSFLLGEPKLLLPAGTVIMTKIRLLDIGFQLSYDTTLKYDSSGNTPIYLLGGSSVDINRPEYPYLSFVVIRPLKDCRLPSHNEYKLYCSSKLVI